ncbi:MAG: carboxypeptidase-like regulatory domain-containing protein, partial [Bacteroidota bacterium]
MKYLLLLVGLFFAIAIKSQSLKGMVLSGDQPVPFCNVTLESGQGTMTSSDGAFELNVAGETIPLKLTFSSIGFTSQTISVNQLDASIEVELTRSEITLDDAVITGTLDVVCKKASPVSVSVLP